MVDSTPCTYLHTLVNIRDVGGTRNAHRATYTYYGLAEVLHYTLPDTAM